MRAQTGPWWSAIPALLLAFALAGAQAQDAVRGPGGLLQIPAAARLTDSAGVLAPAQRSALQERLAAFEAARGSQVVVVVVPSTQPEPIEDFAHRLGEAWKVGRRDIGDGVLVIIAVQDRHVRIDVARALQGAIPDVMASRIIREKMAPRLVAGDYDGAISAALDGLFALIQGENLPAGPGAQQEPDTASGDLLQRLAPFVIGGVIIGSLLRRLLGAIGALVAAGGAAAIAGLVLSSTVLAAGVGLAVFLFTIFSGPLLLATQVLGGPGGRGGFSGGLGGGGGFRSGGGGDFSGGGASGNW